MTSTSCSENPGTLFVAIVCGQKECATLLPSGACTVALCIASLIFYAGLDVLE